MRFGSMDSTGPHIQATGPRDSGAGLSRLPAVGRRGRHMVHVKDDGVYEAPIDKIWKYLQDDTPGVHNHRSILAAKTLEEKGNSMTQEWEMRNPDGKSSRKETWRLTFNPPIGFEMESLGGASKGTRYSHKYTPLGNKTRVEVEGEFKMQGMDDSQTRKAVLGFLSEVFDEDTRSLRAYK